MKFLRQLGEQILPKVDKGLLLFIILLGSPIFYYIYSMKKYLYATCFVLLSLATHAQSVKDLASSVGTWEGKLTYLDYVSAKPYTMSAILKISLTQDKMGYIMGYEYPTEPHANARDTTYVTNNLFGKDKMIEFKTTTDGGFIFITEIEGEDGNDHKKAMLRHTYVLTANSYSIVKEVKFNNSDKWIKRNEYLLNKIGH